MSRASAGLALLFLTACTGGSAPAVEPSAAAPDPCSEVGATSVPASCIPGESGDFGAIPAQSGSPPTSSTSIPPVTAPPVPGELARGGNDKDPAQTTQTFAVTLPPGQRLRTTLACQGATTVRLVTSPQSGAEQEFACGYELPAELTVEDSVPTKAATRYTVTVTAPAPARWYVVVSATAEAPPAS